MLSLDIVAIIEVWIPASFKTLTFFNVSSNDPGFLMKSCVFFEPSIDIW